MTNNELVKPTDISIKDKKTLLKGKVIRLITYVRTKILEVETEDHEKFYLIYYKNSLIYGGKLTKDSKGVFIEKALREGIVISHPHPMMSALIPEQAVSIPNKKKLFSHLQKSHSLQEVTYIATTVDSFFEKEDLIQIIEKFYSHFRQDGKFRKAFQVIQILVSFAPEFKSAYERMNALDYHAYHEEYNPSHLPSIQKKDPLFVETHCFIHRNDPEKRAILHKLLKEQERLIESLLLWMESVPEHLNKENLKDYTDIALTFVSMDQWILILKEMNINPFKLLPEAKHIIEKMLHEQHYETAALYLFDFIDDLPTDFHPILNDLWEHLEARFIVDHFDQALSILKLPVDNTHQNDAEKKLFQLAVKLLEDHDVKTVYNKLLPIKVSHPHSRVLEKLKTMLELTEDPDRMMELGKFYAEFNQLDDAIECFFWEMELHPQDPTPVSKISKMYQRKGMVKEAAAYQEIYVQLNSNQVTG